jgi:phage protein D
MSDPRDVLLDSTTPKFYIGGRERVELARNVVGVVVEETTAGLKRLHLSLDAIGPQRGARDEQLLYLDGDIIDFGVEIKVAMGRASQAVTVFSGKVSGMELIMEQSSTPRVKVFAEDKLMDLRMTRRFKTYEDVSEADLVQQIASQHGLSAAADVDGPTYNTVQQWNQSDLAFLRDRARRLAADVWVEDGRLHMATRDKRNGNRLTLIQGNDLVAVELRADLAHQRSSVRVGGFNEVDKDAIDEEAASSVVGTEASGGRIGIDVLTQAVGERISHHIRDVPLKEDQAKAWGKANLLRRARRFVTMHGVTIGSPAITVGSLLKLERVAKVFEGDGYYVTRVAHSFDTNLGFRTDFDAERAWIGRSA